MRNAVSLDGFALQDLGVVLGDGVKSRDYRLDAYVSRVVLDPELEDEVRVDILVLEEVEGRRPLSYSRLTETRPARYPRETR